MKNKLCKIKLFLIPCKINKYRPKFLNTRFLFYYAIFLFILKIAVIPFLLYFPQTAFFANLTKTGLIELTNSARQNLGYQTLKENPALSQAAYIKAVDMVEKGYFDHYTPEGYPPWYWLQRMGYNYSSAGENLAIGFLESEQVHSAWMNSYSHKQNILNPKYQEIGIAVLKANFQGNETTLVVQFFGTPQIVFAEIQEPQPIIEKETITEELPELKEPDIPETDINDIIPIEEQEQEIKEKIILVSGEQDIEKTFSLVLFEFMTSKYYNMIQKIIYGSLALIIFYLIITIYCDIFIYRKFRIDYKDVVFKTVGFSILWFILLFLDKMIIIDLINPLNFRIY